MVCPQKNTNKVGALQLLVCKPHEFYSIIVYYNYVYTYPVIIVMGPVHPQVSMIGNSLTAKKACVLILLLTRWSVVVLIITIIILILIIILKSLDWFKGKFTGNHGFYHQI